MQHIYTLLSRTVAVHARAAWRAGPQQRGARGHKRVELAQRHRRLLRARGAPKRPGFRAVVPRDVAHGVAEHGHRLRVGGDCDEVRHDGVHARHAAEEAALASVVAEPARARAAVAMVSHVFGIWRLMAVVRTGILTLLPICSSLVMCDACTWASGKRTLGCHGSMASTLSCSSRAS
jgi:hypothetical protein